MTWKATKVAWSWNIWNCSTMFNCKFNQQLANQSCQMKAAFFVALVMCWSAVQTALFVLAMQVLGKQHAIWKLQSATAGLYMCVWFRHVLFSASLGQEVYAELRLLIIVARVSITDPYCPLQVCQHHLWPAAESDSGQTISNPESTLRGAAQNTDWLWLV